MPDSTLGHELFSSITHGVGVILSLATLVLLLVLNPSPSLFKIVGVSIFGGCLLFTYLTSTLYHSLTFTKARTVFYVLDRAGIFLLIAGTYTPFLLVLLNGTPRLVSLMLLWSVTILGLTLQIFFLKKSCLLMPLIYLILGWGGLLLLPVIFQMLSHQAGLMIILGGIFYSVGVIFLFLKKIPFHHGIWHLCVIAGTLCHCLPMFFLK